MDSEQTNMNNHENDNSLTLEKNDEIDRPNTMEEAPEYKEKTDDAQNRERGELVNKAVVNGSENTTEDIDPFWQSHPELLEEAKQMNAPLTAKDFKEQGFVFAEEDDGKKHIWATTPEYKKWQEEGKKGPVPKRHENLKDQEYKRSREEYFAHLRNQMRIDREYEEKLAKRKDSLEKLINEEGVDIFSKETVDNVYDKLYPDGIEGARDNVVKKRILEGLERAEKNMLDDIHYKVTNLYRNEYSNAFRNDTLQIPDQSERLKRIKGDLTLDFAYPGDRKFNNVAGRVAEPLIEIYKKEKLPNISVKAPSGEELQEIKIDMAKNIISRGGFFPSTFNNNPENIDGIMAEIGIDKNNNEIIESALLGYGGKSEGAEIDYFNLKDEVAKRIYGEYSDIYPSDDKERLIFSRWHYGRTELSPEVSAKAVGKIKDATEKLVEQISTDTKVGELTKKELEKTANRERKELTDRLYNGDNSINISHYLSIKKIGIPSRGFLDDYINHLINEAGEKSLKCFIDKEELLNAAPDVNKEVDSNYENVLRDGLLDRLRTGVRKTNGEVRYLAGIFETEMFLENQESLGIDFKNPEVFEMAFDGFMNTLKSKNGELHEQADWYYENIFANDPGKFLAMEKAFREESDDVGAKGKITKFFKNNPQAFEDRARALLEERLQKEINNEQHAIKSSMVQDIPKGDFKKMLDKYTAYLLQKGNEHTTEIGSAFTGEHRRTSGKEEETGKVDRREKAFDFALDKVRCFKKYESFIEQNVADGDINRFCTAFVSDMNYDRMYSADNSFMGVEFKYGDKWCAIAESVGADGATYVFRGDNEGEYLDMFDNLRFDARRSDDPRFIAIDHLGSEHFDDSLDLTYKKVFLFLKTGEKALRYYNAFGSNNEKAKREWDKRQKEEFSAWPMGIKAEDEEDDDYKAWHEKQDAIEARLKEALERGGQEELEAERRRIEEEDYDRLMNEVA